MTQKNDSTEKALIDDNRCEPVGEISEKNGEKKVDPLYQMFKPLHNLPRGKNAWDPQFIKKSWFWPLSAGILILLSCIYPHVLAFFAG